ncbi:methyltransferase domain-containing protein [Bradyrhizobium sp. ma5]|uniref:methyltransferase domain-containing protein n=1 Tax=Bradyrhizobium sp. ma5 TaxID=3344828 RepID=UPI0035D3F533
MARELAYNDEAASEYDRAFAARLDTLSAVSLERRSGSARHEDILDVATGTGLAAAACSRAVGPTGQVVAADLSEAMVEQAKRNLNSVSNVTFAVEDGQALSFEDGSFDALTCSLGLMFFPDPARGLAEFFACPSPRRTCCGVRPHSPRTVLQWPDQCRHSPTLARDQRGD